MNIVAIFVLVTAGMSFWGFQDAAFKEKYLFYPYRDRRNKRWLPFIVSNFLHGDLFHLGFNMMALASFGGFALPNNPPNYGSFMDSIARMGFGRFSVIMFITCYLGGMLVTKTILYFRHRHDPNYSSLGASAGTGALSAAAIVFVPNLQVSMFFIPMPIPGILFEALFLAYSFLMRNSDDRIGHLAHFIGGIYGILFGVIVKYLLWQ